MPIFTRRLNHASQDSYEGKSQDRLHYELLTTCTIGHRIGMKVHCSKMFMHMGFLHVSCSRKPSEYNRTNNDYVGSPSEMKNTKIPVERLAN